VEASVGKNWAQAQIDRAVVYRAFAEAHDDDRISTVYRQLAAVEEAHAEVRAKQSGADAPPSPSVRGRVLAFAARGLDPAVILPAVAPSQKPSGDGGSRRAAEEAQERARVVQRAARSVGGLSGATLAQLEGLQSGGGGNALRAAVLGANDGLVSNLSLVMGVAGAAVAGHTILLTGLAGLVAGSCSMAMGEWLSVNSAREMHQRQIDEEARQIEAHPDLEQEELVVIYQAKGLDERVARSLSEKMFQSKDAVLDTMAREELGVDPEELGGSAWAAAASSFLLFAAGAFFPVAPFAFASGWTAIAASLGLSGCVLAGIGAVTSRFTGRGVIYSATRQLLIGYAAALLTFGVGKLIGVTVAG
jgi:VIT1/CCC1 family predicted Fe2+/Mn2+ transporter